MTPEERAHLAHFLARIAERLAQRQVECGYSAKRRPMAELCGELTEELEV